eukprot:COSAG04_NODE_3626_length_2662_cov_94.554038_2_plen_61_part_00
MAVARCGKLVYDEVYGCMDVEGKVPLRSDAIYRLASMTKYASLPPRTRPSPPPTSWLPEL